MGWQFFGVWRRTGEDRTGGGAGRSRGGTRSGLHLQSLYPVLGRAARHQQNSCSESGIAPFQGLLWTVQCPYGQILGQHACWHAHHTLKNALPLPIPSCLPLHASALVGFLGIEDTQRVCTKAGAAFRACLGALALMWGCHLALPHQHYGEGGRVVLWISFLFK